MNELFADPGTLDLERERQEIAARFAEAGGFPTISGLPSDLGVSLTERSPVVPDERSAIDTIEADAVPASQDAPAVPPGHAKRAYAASPRRRQAERAQAGSAEVVRVEPEDAPARIFLALREACGASTRQAAVLGLAIP